VDAHGYGKRFVVRADEILSAFLELQRGDTRVRGGFDIVTARAETCVPMVSWRRLLESESGIRSATRRKSACDENLPPDRAAKP